jgi:hypothetical protein
LIRRALEGRAPVRASCQPRTASGRTDRQNWEAALDEVAGFVERLPRRRSRRVAP